MFGGEPKEEVALIVDEEQIPQLAKVEVACIGAHLEQTISPVPFCTPPYLWYSSAHDFLRDPELGSDDPLTCQKQFQHRYKLIKRGPIK